ncbi:AraC family transcriptional regulator [Nostoc sp.]|uniref:AraC family transcriptional regulator n=1 Tax=Nostoc sp. TaxID=1180 RepID=UPI002FF64A74
MGIHSVSIPAFCAIAQGSKEVLLGSDRYQYDPIPNFSPHLSLSRGAGEQRSRGEFKSPSSFPSAPPSPQACEKCGPMHYLLATVELPIVSQILEASKEQPYLSLRLDLDPILLLCRIIHGETATPQDKGVVRKLARKEILTIEGNALG